MSTIQVLILSIFIAFLILENYGYGYWMISRPIFAGPLIGLLLGDVQTGLLVGGSVELMYMGVIPVGGKRAAQCADRRYSLHSICHFEWWKCRGWNCVGVADWIAGAAFDYAGMESEYYSDSRGG